MSEDNILVKDLKKFWSFFVNIIFVIMFIASIISVFGVIWLNLPLLIFGWELTSQGLLVNKIMIFYLALIGSGVVIYLSCNLLGGDE